MALGNRAVALVLLVGLATGLRGEEAVPAPDAPQSTSDAPAPQPATTAPATDAAAGKDEAKPFKLEDLAWRKGEVSIVPFGIGIFNVNYNSRSLFIGSYALYANPGNALNPAQFEMSPQNSFLGVDITGPTIGGAKTDGRIDFDFRGPTPIQNNAVPFFYDIFGEIKTDRWRFLLGQTKDVVSPLDPTVLNFTNGMVGYMPGDIGFFRPQVRLELYCPMGDSAQFTWQGSLNQEVVQPLQSAPDLFGTGAGWPDIQGRVALALGPLEGTQRPFEVGVSALIGERVLEIVAPPELRHYRVWSVCLDARAALVEQTSIQGEVYVGQVLGSYDGGIFQGIDPITLNPIRGSGGWLELEQRFTDSVRGHLGCGIDEVNDNDLSVGSRAQNLACWGNVYWDITKQLTWAGEVSWWETRYIGVPNGIVTRIETTVLYRF